MAEIVRRRSWGGVLPLGRHVSISGSSFIQCASASIAPPHPGGAKCYPGAEVQGRTGSKASQLYSYYAFNQLYPSYYPPPPWDAFFIFKSAAYFEFGHFGRVGGRSALR